MSNWQRGQVFFFFNHSSAHCAWKVCRQGSVRTGWPAQTSSRQTQQVRNSSGSLPTSVTVHAAVLCSISPALAPSRDCCRCCSTNSRRRSSSCGARGGRRAEVEGGGGNGRGGREGEDARRGLRGRRRRRGTHQRRDLPGLQPADDAGWRCAAAAAAAAGRVVQRRSERAQAGELLHAARRQGHAVHSRAVRAAAVQRTAR